MAQLWIKTSADSEVEGPITAVELRNRAWAGQFGPEGFISVDGVRWQSATKVKNLFPAGLDIQPEPISAGSHGEKQFWEEPAPPPALNAGIHTAITGRQVELAPKRRSRRGLWLVILLLIILLIVGVVVFAMHQGYTVADLKRMVGLH